MKGARKMRLIMERRDWCDRYEVSVHIHKGEEIKVRVVPTSLTGNRGFIVLETPAPKKGDIPVKLFFDNSLESAQALYEQLGQAIEEVKAMGSKAENAF